MKAKEAIGPELCWEQFYPEDPMLLSCGVIVISEARQILLAHVTHAPQWDIPKGCADPGELPRQAALRETREECGLQLEAMPLLDLGRFDYQVRKYLHLFALKLPASSVDLRNCHCSTMFTDRRGREFPEVDAFRWVPFDEIPLHCKPRMAKVLLEAVNVDALHTRLDTYLGEVPVQRHSEPLV